MEFAVGVEDTGIDPFVQSAAGQGILVCIGAGRIAVSVTGIGVADTAPCGVAAATCCAYADV